MAGGVHSATVISSDRYLIKIIDRTVSFSDIEFQLRNIKALNCIYDDALVIQYFGKGFIQELTQFVMNMPKKDEEVRTYLSSHEPILKKIRFFFKILRYSEDQKADITPKLEQIIKEATTENKCDKSVLYKDSLKTNFKHLLEMELYLRSRYGAQLKNTQGFETIRPSIELFVESLDKQFTHEYYW